MGSKIVTIGTTPTLIMELNADRDAYFIQNQGSDVVYLGKDNVTASGVAKGRTLGVREVETGTVSKSPELVRGRIYGIVASGTQDILIDDGILAERYGIMWQDLSGNPLIPASDATTPTLYNVTCTNADQEYSQVLNEKTKKVYFSFRSTSHAGRYAFVTGKVAAPTAPYRTLPSGVEKAIEGVYLTSKTLFFCCTTAGGVLEIEEWV